MNVYTATNKQTNKQNPVTGMVIIQVFHVQSISELYFPFIVKVAWKRKEKILVYIFIIVALYLVLLKELKNSFKTKKVE
jgi:hypothetical protein